MSRQVVCLPSVGPAWCLYRCCFPTDLGSSFPVVAATAGTLGLAGQPNSEVSYAARYAHKRISYVLQIIETSQTTEYKWICHQQRRSSPNANNLIVLFLPWSRREEARKIAQRKRERKVAARKHEGAFGTANQCRTSG